MASILLSGKYSNKSYITFGDYQEEGRDKTNQIFYDEDFGGIVSHRVAGSFHWSLHLQSFSLGDFKFNMTKNRVLTDTGSSRIFIPRKTYAEFLERFC